MKIIKNILEEIDVNQIKDFAYTLDKKRNPKVDLNPDPTIRKEQEELGYNDKNTNMYLAFDDEDDVPSFVKNINTCFDLENTSICLFLQTPGQMTAPHFDTFIGYKQRYNISDENFHKIKRFIVFLDDGKFGHTFSVDNHTFSNWKQGDVIETGSNIFHASANSGVEPRVSLSITGYDRNNKYG